MTGHDLSTTLFRIEPEANMQRFYSVTVQPNLFGGHSVIRNWGRIGTGGQLRVDLHTTEAEATRAHNRVLSAKARRGYRRPISNVIPRQNKL